MTLTTEDTAILKILVEKELEHIEKDGEKLVISNADWITKIADSPDLPFLKSIEKYKEYLHDLLKRL